MLRSYSWLYDTAELVPLVGLHAHLLFRTFAFIYLVFDLKVSFCAISMHREEDYKECLTKDLGMISGMLF